VSLEEDTLGNTAVLNSIFKDVQSIVVKVVVNSAFADTIVFCGVFNNWLLEITLEMKDLSTKSLGFVKLYLPACHA
jgi:hypothetical protein